ncbi:MAG: hypothetical protein DWB42_21015, partial [Chloroflexi bacterium]|nr:hypothetical protein [Chloroflexota bacterium]
MFVADLHINTDAMVDFLVGLLNTPSPTGYHVEAMAYIRQTFAGLEIPGLTLATTGKGALL